MATRSRYVMAASTIVIASTLRRTRVSPGPSVVEGSVTAVGLGIGEHAEYEARRSASMVDSGRMVDVKATVLVTDPEYRKGEASYAAASGVECVPAPDVEKDLARAILDSNVRYVIVGNRQYAGPLYDALPSGGVIARMGVGHDGIDKARATAARLICTNTPGVLDQSVAEHAMLLIAAAARKFLPALA